MDIQSSDDKAIQQARVPDLQCSELSRLFVVCGRCCKLEDLRALFLTCGPIKHLHLALDRSKKSRGFAFLQYEDPANAVAAIEKFDHKKLDDGHILKVTVAKERPVGGNGKLKRNQHACQALDEKTVENPGEDDGEGGARIPGKRQRSSPPILALPFGGQNRVKPAVLSENHLHKEMSAMASEKKNLKTKIVSPLPLPLPDEVQLQVEQVMGALVYAVVLHETQSRVVKSLNDTYNHVISMFGQVEKQEKSASLSEVKQEPEDDNSTDSLASSIRSVSLVSTPLVTPRYPFKAPENPRMENDSGVMRPRRFKYHLRRRRQSLGGSDSSADNISDGSSGRRKRSNTTTSSTPMLSAHTHTRAKPQPSSPLRKSSDQPVSCDAFLVDSTSKKHCKRQSSDNGLEESYRLAKQQATQERRETDGYIGTGDDKDRDIKFDFKTELSKPTKLFFTSTYKFTKQELEAMFVVYGDFESVELVKSFGRIKTMAYIRFTNPTTADLVVKSLREESSQGDEDPEQAEFMTLSFAHETGIKQRRRSEQFRPGNTSDRSSSLYLTVPPQDNSVATPTSSSSPGKDRLWVLLLYNRFLATHLLSSVVSPLSGMEFMDIKVVKSTGEAEGVAFVKFDSETNATQAAFHLHQMELPLGSGKFLQAIVIQAPSLFSTTHGSSAAKSNEAMQLNHPADERGIARFSEDTDLCAVEARFAHLMRTTDHPYTKEGQHYHHHSCPPCCGGATPGDQLSPTAVGVYPRSDDFSPGLSTGQEQYPIQFMMFPPPQPHFQPYGSYGLGNYQQWLQHQAVGGSAPGWMEATPYYRNDIQHYPFSCAPEREMAFPLGHRSSSMGNIRNSPAVTPRLHSSSEIVSDEAANNNCSTRDSCSIQISTSEPLKLVTLVSALQDCPGVVSFAKSAAPGGSDLTGFLVKFSSEAQASEAMHKLDGSLCGGQKLRAVKNSPSRQRSSGGGGKARSNSGRRKRQRVDPRTRK